jgi:hypothetical protein
MLNGAIERDDPPDGPLCEVDYVRLRRDQGVAHGYHRPIRGGRVMSRVQPKSSPTDQYARRIAVAIAKGRPPPLSAKLEHYCESFPREIFSAFAGAARHMPPAGSDEALAIGYLFLLQRLLEHLRYRTDRGYADAAKLIAEFQVDVVAQIEAGHVDARMCRRGAASGENPSLARVCCRLGRAR